MKLFAFVFNGYEYDIFCSKTMNENATDRTYIAVLDVEPKSMDTEPYWSKEDTISVGDIVCDINGNKYLINEID